MRSPLIGISGRRLAAGVIDRMDPRFGDRMVDVYFGDFARCVSDAGGIPVEVPFEADAAELMEHLDGMVVTGGQDVHPALWGGDLSVVDPAALPRRDYAVHDAERDSYEAALMRAAIVSRVPLLTVCRGTQLLNVVTGGTLVPDLPASGVNHLDVPGALSDGPAGHVVGFAPESLAGRIFGPRRQVNSWHHQAVATPGADVVVTGRTSDGVVESIEIPGSPVLGLQWHPEWQLTPDPVFRWLVGAARAAADAPVLGQSA